MAKTLGAVSAIGVLVARRWQLVHVIDIVGDDAGRGDGLRQELLLRGEDTKHKE